MRNSHELVMYLMILMNYHSAVEMIKYKNGINHTLSLTGSQNIFKYINFNTRINILESWIYGYKKPKIDSEGLFIDDQYADFSNSYKRHWSPAAWGRSAAGC